jgi:hypothetical protein
MRVIVRNRVEERSPSSSSSTAGKRRMNRSEQDSMYKPDKNSKRKTKLEWKDRAVIRQDVFTVCKDRSVRPVILIFLISNLHFDNLYSSTLNLCLSSRPYAHFSLAQQPFILPPSTYTSASSDLLPPLQDSHAQTFPLRTPTAIRGRRSFKVQREYAFCHSDTWRKSHWVRGSSSSSSGRKSASACRGRAARSEPRVPGSSSGGKSASATPTRRGRSTGSEPTVLGPSSSRTQNNFLRRSPHIFISFKNSQKRDHSF